MYGVHDLDDTWPAATPVLSKWWDVTARVETTTPDGRTIIGSHRLSFHEASGDIATEKFHKNFTLREGQRILDTTCVPAQQTVVPLRPGFRTDVPWTPPVPYVPPPPRVQETFAPVEGLTEVIRLKPTVQRLYITEGVKNDQAAP